MDDLKALAPLRAGRLAPTVPDGRPNPARVYHDAKAAGSRPAVRAVLCRLAGWLQGLDQPMTWPEVCAVPWWEVRARHVALLRARLIEVSAPRTVNRDLSILRGVLRTAWRNEMMTTDAFQRTIDEPGVPKDSTKAGRALTVGEIGKLLGAADAKTRAVLAIMYGAGLRRIEIARLRLDDVDAASGTLTVLGKRAKRRAAYLGPGWRRYLTAWLEARGPVPGAFVGHGRMHAHYHPNGIGALVEATRVKAGVGKFTPHDLRRSYGTHLLTAGNDLSLVRDLMGHEDIRTTAVYDRRGEAEQRAAADAISVPEEEK